ncbi:MAG TPA: hypothetical protein VG245_07155 [Candidatus Dormibacteraeota bacterium]|jgi:deoxycytidine triphosphate deaminase|nr:hypothetical protein [Candidatus Dormibacteraeota bacterium]
MGVLYTGEDLRRALDDGKIFRPGTWHPDCLRSSGYNIRVASDYMIIPVGEHAERTMRVIPKGRRHTGDISLRPGENAFVSSEERLALDWTLTGNVGSRFSNTVRGLMVLTGMVVDPGYGWVKAPSGELRADEDQRLHFVIANVGARTTTLRPGIDQIAVMQVFSCAPPQTPRPVSSTGVEYLDDLMRGEGEEGQLALAYFRDVRDLFKRTGKLTTVVEQTSGRVDRVEAHTSSVVVFGVYVLAMALLALTFAEVPKFLAGMDPAQGWANPSTIAAGLFVLAVLIVTWRALSAMKRPQK